MTNSRKGARSDRHRASRGWPVALVALTLAGLACSLFERGLQSSGTSPQSSAGVSTTGSLKAEATSAISVQLTWVPAEDASQYVVELQVGDQKAVKVATLAPTVVSYEAFPVVPGSELTFRVRAATSTGEREIGTAKLTTPPETPKPLTVKVNYEQNTFAIPTFDPNNPNIDPKSFMPPGFDPSNPDMSLLQPGPKTVWQVIGAEGGKVEATSAKGVGFTLTVPPNAVAFAVPIGLTPVDSIEGLPMSGGMIGAVRVEPEGIEFAHPVELAITASEDAAPLAEGNVVMGFGVTGPSEGSEFYFVPQVKKSATDTSGHAWGRLAALAEQRSAVGPLPGVNLRSYEGGTVGGGSGTVAGARATVKDHPPSNSAHRTSSKISAQQVEELGADGAGQSIITEATKAGSTDEFMQTLTDFQAYLEAGGGPWSEDIWDEVLVNTKAMFELAKYRCFNRDGFTAAGVAERMASADEGTFWSEFRDRYVKKHGQKSLDDALDFAKRCKLSLNIQSKLAWSLESAGVSLDYDVKVAVKPLVLAYQSDPESPKYGVYLRGYALVYPDRVEMNVQGCKQVVLNPFPTEFIRIGLRPKFDNSGNLSNFEIVDFGGGGGMAKLTQKCDDSTSSAMLTVPNGGAWGGLFTDARRGKVSFTGFSISSPAPSSGEIAFKWFPEAGSGNTGVSGATVKEETKFSLVLGQ